MSDIIKSWATLTLKAVDVEQRLIRGIASTPGTDRAGDSVDPEGAKFTLPLPLLSQHDHASPIGEVTHARVTKAGIEIEARIPKDTGLEYVERAWRQIKANLIRGLSIGFRALEAEPVKGARSGALRFTSWEWIELSAVTVPCNADASITNIKNYDTAGGQMPEILRIADVRERVAATLNTSAAALTHSRNTP